MALLTPALIGVSLIFKTGGIRAGVKGAGVKKGPAEKGPIRYADNNLLLSDAADTNKGPLYPFFLV